MLAAADVVDGVAGRTKGLLGRTATKGRWSSLGPGPSTRSGCASPSTWRSATGRWWSSAWPGCHHCGWPCPGGVPHRHRGGGGCLRAVGTAGRRQAGAAGMTGDPGPVVRATGRQSTTMMPLKPGAPPIESGAGGGRNPHRQSRVTCHPGPWRLCDGRRRLLRGHPPLPQTADPCRNHRGAARSLHEHNEEDRVAEVLAAGGTGRTVALVSDAGMPASRIPDGAWWPRRPRPG